MSVTFHELATATYGDATPVAPSVCANCDHHLQAGAELSAVDAPGELFCRWCVIKCTGCSRFVHYTYNIPNAGMGPRRQAVGTCTECSDAPVPISVVRLQF